MRNTLKEIVYSDESKVVFTYGSNGRLIGGYSEDKDGNKTDEIQAVLGTTPATLLVYDYTTNGKK